MRENEEKMLANITDVINALPTFDRGVLYGYAARAVEGNRPPQISKEGIE